MSQKEKRFPLEKRTVNWLYFGIIFLFLSLLSFVHFFHSTYIGFSRFLYALSLFFETFAETLFFYLAAFLINKLKRRIFYYSFISFIFIILLLQSIHFMMLRIMDSSLLHFFKTFLSAGSDNFIVLLRACNINILFLIFSILLFILLPIAGPGLYFLTKKLIRNSNFSISIRTIVILEIFCLITLLGLEKSEKKIFSSHEWHYFQKTMPFGSSFQKNATISMKLKSPIKKPISPTALLEKAKSSIKKTNLKPNIYFFVIEALRRDFLSSEIAPNIYTFSKECLSFENTLSNSNATHMSWFSIFHGSYPYHWKYFQENYQSGSPILQILKNLGYEISIISSAELPYFQMDEVLFGKDHYLTDFYQNFIGQTPDRRDFFCFDLLKEKTTKKEGQLFIVFLDSTHSEYSWPKSFNAPFQPVSDSINYVELSYNKKNLGKLKNRYSNAINYIDHLFGSFIFFLKEKKIYEDSIIVLTGDHGEEFFEENSLFHGSHLNRYQLSVPIMCKFKDPPTHQNKIASHMDIFPSILDFLTQRKDVISLFDGFSFFDMQRPVFTIATAQNANLAPENIALIDDNMIFNFHILTKGNFYETTHLRFLSQKPFGKDKKILSNKQALVLTEKNLMFLIND